MAERKGRKAVLPVESAGIFLKGVLMGAADIIPGISGGTIALITGIYERLVASISDIDFKFLPAVLKGRREEAAENFRKIDFPLFIPLLTGIGLSILLMSSIIHRLLEDVPAVSYSFFFGTILASALVIYRKERLPLLSGFPSLFIGFAAAFLLSGAGTYRMGHSLPEIFLSALVAICAMILPGISGAAVLLVLNQYGYVLSAVKNFDITVMAVFSSGALTGILSFSRLVRFLLRKFRTQTMSALTGLMLGALRLPFRETVDSAGNAFFVPLVSCALGFAAVILLEFGFSFQKRQNA